MKFNVKEIKKIIEKLPDETDVYIGDGIDMLEIKDIYIENLNTACGFGEEECLEFTGLQLSEFEKEYLYIEIGEIKWQK